LTQIPAYRFEDRFHGFQNRSPAYDRALRADYIQGRALELGEVVLGRFLNQETIVATVVGSAHSGLHSHSDIHTADAEQALIEHSTDHPLADEDT
jgi:hypothetical protein